MNPDHRLVRLITCSNWILFFLGSSLSFVLTEPVFARGVVFGGLIVTVNFHLLYRTLRRAFRPDSLGSYNVVLIKYYIRFTVSGLIILLLIERGFVSPVGLLIGLSVVVVSLMFAAVIGLKKLIFKEAV